MSFHQQPYDPYYYYPQPQDHTATYNNVVIGGGVNTLFVSGLPEDVKAREIHNLFRRYPGFDLCQLKYTGRGNQVVAFATFFNHQSAIGAMHALNGVKFDPQAGLTLHIEMARSNSRRKIKPGSGPYIVINRRTQSVANAQETSSDDGDRNAGDGASSEENDSANKDDPVDVTSDVAAESGNFSTASNMQQEQPERTVEGGTQACSTLFIANLGPQCTETELKQVLSGFPGFNIVKVRARGGMPVAFADFEETEQAVNAMQELQDSLLSSSDRGGMHIEYARSKMRKT